MDKLTDEFIRLVQASGDQGLPDTSIHEHFQTRYEQLLPVINNLLASNRLSLFKPENKPGSLIYKHIKEETAVKFEGLGPEQMLVFQIIEKSGNQGIWTRDIKITTNIQQQVLTKTLKILEQRNLIKSVRSVVSKSKKLYMLYNLEPSKEISGGPWYTDQEFDHEFIDAVSTLILSFIGEKMKDLQGIGEHVRNSGLSKVELTNDDIYMIIQTLVYDGKLEEINGAIAAMTGNKVDAVMYKKSKSFPPMDYYTDIPCGICPVIDRCCEGGTISPLTCEYLKKWLGNDW